MKSILANLAEAASNRRPGVTTSLVDCQEYVDLGPNPDEAGVYYLSLVCNSDGAQIGRKGVSFKMHPVQFCIAELPFGLMVKQENLVLAAVNVGKKVDMHALYEPVEDQLKDLGLNGFTIDYNGGRYRFKTRLLNGLVDLVERAKLLNMLGHM